MTERDDCFVDKGPGFRGQRPLLGGRKRSSTDSLRGLTWVGASRFRLMRCRFCVRTILHLPVSSRPSHWQTGIVRGQAGVVRRYERSRSFFVGTGRSRKRSGPDPSVPRDWVTSLSNARK